MKSILHRIQEFTRWASAQPQRQIDFFASDAFMFGVFGTFLAGLVIAILTH